MNIILHIIRILCFFILFMNFGAYASDLPQGFPLERQEDRDLVVVELFTSQGCNSCPPADEILAEFSQEKNILALSYSVDYWNYLGWKDTLAQHDCTIRQKKYNISLGKSGVYTPQMIIQGQKDLIGSRRDLAHKMVTSARKGARNKAVPAPTIAFGALKSPTNDMIDLKIGAGAHRKTATIWIIGYDLVKTVNIRGGELKGQTRSYHNVVQSIKRMGSWMGDEIRLTLSKQDIGSGKYDAYAVLLQEEETGPIIAAAKLSLK